MVRGRAGRWHDLVIGDACIDGDVFSADPAPAVFASDYVPLWAGLAAPGSAQAAAVVASLRRSGARATPVRTTHGPRTTCLVRTIISLSVLQGASAASFYQRCLEEACPCLMSSLGLDLTGTAPSLRHPMQGCAYAAFADVAAWRLGLLRRGGVMASLQETGQQWDAPNAWPPLQALLAEGLATYGGAPGMLHPLVVRGSAGSTANELHAVGYRHDRGACTGRYVYMHASARSLQRQGCHVVTLLTWLRAAWLPVVSQARLASPPAVVLAILILCMRVCRSGGRGTCAPAGAGVACKCACVLAAHRRDGRKA